MLCQNISKDNMVEMERKFKEELGGKNGCSAAVGQNFMENSGDLSLIMEEADKRMYADKEAYYKKLSAEENV